MNESGKCAIITGGAQGIGKATTRRLLDAGWAVTIADIDEEAGRETADEFRDYGSLYYAPTDVADEGQVRQVIADTAARFGGIDLLMNNAYQSLPWVSIENYSLEQWNRALSVNLTSAFLTTKYAVPHLRARRGCIVNISSILALRTYPNTVAYSSGKGALAALTHALAVSLGPEIRVNCISPGMIDTSGWVKSTRHRRKGYPEEIHRMHPAGRIGVPEDIAAVVAFLVSSDADFITGQNVVIDGGAMRIMRAFPSDEMT